MTNYERADALRTFEELLLTATRLNHKLSLTDCKLASDISDALLNNLQNTYRLFYDTLFFDATKSKIYEGVV